MNRAYDTNLFGFAFWSFIFTYVWTKHYVSSKMYLQSSFYVFLDFTVVLFGAWGKIFVWFFKSETYVFQNKNHPSFFWWLWYLYCVVSNERFAIIFLDNITILFLSVCRFLLLKIYVQGWYDQTVVQEENDVNLQKYEKYQVIKWWMYIW